MSTAIVIDGAFFLRRIRHSFPDLEVDASALASAVTAIAAFHVAAGLGYAPLSAARAAVRTNEESTELFRIFFYDCPPLKKRMHRPVSRRAINMAHSPEAILRDELHRTLPSVRKVALRLGRLSESFAGWRVKAEAMRRWLDGVPFEPDDDDFEIDVVQKGVDMRLGLDISAMAFKGQVKRITLIAADADFVPAVKLARREGIDVVLDPMGVSAAPDLLQNVDGVRTAVIDRLFDGPYQ